MKIYYLCDLPLTEGAAAIHVLEISNNLSKTNKVSLFAPKIKEKTSIKSKLSIKYIPYLDFKIIKNLSYQIFLFFYLLNKIISQRPNALYYRQSYFFIVPSILSKIFSIPCISEINGTIEEEMILTKDPKWMIKIAILIENFCYRNANKIIAASPVLMKYITKKYNIEESKMISLENGVNIDLFFPKNRLECRKKLKLQEDMFCAGYIGGLQHWQGLDYLIRAIKLVKTRNFKVKFLIIGDGPEKDRLGCLIKELKLEKYVKLLNSIPHSEVPEHINSLDVCICYLTRFKEGKYGSPFKVYEYLSCSKPVILSDIKGVSELFGNNVILAKPENSKDLADKIIYLLKNPKMRNKLGREGRKFVLNGHSWKNVAERTNKIIKEVVKEDGKDL